MGPFRILLIILILLIFVYVMHKLLKERATILNSNKRLVIEGMSAKDEIRNLFGISSTVSIEDMNTKLTNLPLREYCIKASYNSAYTGSSISEDMVKYVIFRGCRFLDLQIHYSENDNLAYVANITDVNGKEMESSNRVALDRILNTIAGNAFTTINGKNGSPNPKDPLFIHLRIIPDKNVKVYDAVAECINKNFSESARVLNNSGKSKLIDKYSQINNEFMKKTVFLMDKTYNPEYSYFSQPLANIINGETGGSTFQMYDYSKMNNKVKTPPIMKDDFQTTNIVVEQIVIPDIYEKYPTPTIINMVNNYGVQITMYPFYKSNDNLRQYEDLFNNFKSAIIPMAYAINYLGKLETDIESRKITIGAFA